MLNSYRISRNSLLLLLLLVIFINKRLLLFLPLLHLLRYTYLLLSIQYYWNYLLLLLKFNCSIVNWTAQYIYLLVDILICIIVFICSRISAFTAFIWFFCIMSWMLYIIIINIILTLIDNSRCIYNVRIEFHILILFSYFI